MSTLATVTGGTIAGLVALVVLLLVCAAIFLYGFAAQSEGDMGVLWWIGGIVCAAIVIGSWWWAMAFTTSGDYHAWNIKEGRVERVAKRLIAVDKGMAERYVVVIKGQPYGIDDTRAALVREGDTVSLRCKKDFQWGVPREAHGWACRWNKLPTVAR